MGFSTTERITQAQKALLAKVLDAAESAQWYETRLPYDSVVDAQKVWTQTPLLKSAPAGSLTIARNNVTGTLAGVVQDLSTTGSAIRLTPVAGTNNSTWVAYNTFNVPASGRLDSWIQPQSIPQSDGSPSIGYSIQLYDGNPATSGSVVTTTAGQTGTGENKSVGWLWDYNNGILLLSADFRSSFTYGDLWVMGFRYIGQTVQNLTGSTSSVPSSITSASYLLATATGSLPNSRVLSASNGVTITDGGAGSTLTVGTNFNVVAARSGTSFSGAVTFSAGLSGSLTRLPNGTSYLNAGSGISITSASSGQVTISATTPAVTSTLPTPTQAGQVLFATTSGSFIPALPLTSLTSGWLLNDQGYLLVSS